MQEFIEKMKEDDINLKQLGINGTKEQILEMLVKVYSL